jgi:hypothetical protein
MIRYPEQSRQHEGDQYDRVFRVVETHLGDQPRPRPTYQSEVPMARQTLSPPSQNLSLYQAHYIFPTMDSHSVK